MQSNSKGERWIEACLPCYRSIAVWEQRLKVLGVDLAVKHTGVVALNICTWPVVPNVTLESHVESADTPRQRIVTANSITEIARITEAQLVVIENYTYQRVSFNSYSTGELSGMLRYALWENGLDQLFCSPMWLKVFLNRYGKTPIKKPEVAKAVHEIFEWKSSMRTAKEREDATDAFALAMVGIFYWMLKTTNLKEDVEEWMTERQRSVFFGHKGKPGLLSPTWFLEGRK